MLINRTLIKCFDIQLCTTCEQKGC